MSEVKLPEDRYLGDGVYASFDGYHIRLDLRAQDNFTRIGLEPEVLIAFDRYRKYVDQWCKARIAELDASEESHEP
jgi:hypothetical protein